MTIKLYAWTTQHFFLYATQMAANAAGVEVEVVVPNEEEAKDPAFVAKKGSWSYPILETEDGTILHETMAICRYLLNKGGKKAWLGENAFQAAQIDQWAYISSTGLAKHWNTVVLNILGHEENADNWNGSINDLGKELLMIEANLAAQTTFAGTKGYSLADILMFRICMPLFSFLLGPEQRAKLPATTAWYEKISRDDMVVKVAGKYHMCAEPWTLYGDATINLTVAAPVEEEAKVEEKEEDLDDLFGDDEDDDQDARMAIKAKAAELKKGTNAKPKKVLIAKSLILYEVKPADSETNLDELAARILKDIKMDGLLWKQEYRKDPVAFGIFKLIIGATVEDDKVSTDDIQELIEAMDDMVQSVDIQSFNKV